MAESSSITESINRASRDAGQRVVSEALAGLSPNTSVGKLIEDFGKSEYDANFRSMTLSELVAAIGGSRGTAKAAAGRAKAGSTGAPRGRRMSINTRTAEGRQAFDAAMAEFLAAKGSSNSEEMQKALGGSAAQIRQAAQRLKKSVKITGQKRSTRYNWKAAGASAKSAAPKKKAAARKKTARKKTAKKQTAKKQAAKK